MSQRDRLKGRKRRRTTETLPGADGGPPETIELQQMIPDDWDDLLPQHPPSDEQAARGEPWNIATFRPALLAASVITPNGEPPLTEQDWAEAAAVGWMAVGELNQLFDACIRLNDRTPQVTAGKG